MAPLSTTARSMTQAFMPTKLRSASVQAWISAIWPMVTSSPIWVGPSAEATWITVPSWMLVRAPMRIGCMSPRMTQPNQTLEPGPISTSPITTAPGAMKASGAIRGSLSR